MAAQDVALTLTANTQQFDRAMDGARAKVVDITGGISTRFRQMANDSVASTQKMQSEMGGHFDGIRNAFSRVNGAFIAFAGLLAGGAMFRNAVQGTAELEKAAIDLGQKLGIGATQASILREALEDVQADAGQLDSAMGKLVKTLNSDEQAITRLGVATRDGNGHFRSQVDIMLDVNQKLMQFKEGTDRNVEAQKIYGKSWQDVQKILLLTRDQIKETEKESRVLGLLVSTENVAAFDAYKKSMNGVNDVMTGIQKAIGDALMPILTKLGNWFSTIGPAAVGLFRVAIGGLALAFQSLVTGVTTAWQTVNAVVNNIGSSVVALGQASALAVQGKFEEAGQTLKNIPKNISGQWKDAFKEINKSALETQALFKQIFGNGTDTAGGAGGKSGTTSDEDKAAGKAGRGKAGGAAASRMQQFEQELAAERYGFEQRRLAQGSFQEFSKTQEQAFWKEILETQKLSLKDKESVQRKYYDVSRDIAKANFAAQLEQLKAEEAALRKDSDERIRISKEIAAAQAQRFGSGSPEAQKAAADAQKVELDVILTSSKRQMALYKEGAQERYEIAEATAERINALAGAESEALMQAKEEAKRIATEEAEHRKNAASQAVDVEAQKIKEGLAVYEEVIKQNAALGLVSRESELRQIEETKQLAFEAERQALQDKMKLYAADEKEFANLQNTLRSLEEKRLKETLAAEREIDAAQRERQQQAARVKIAELNAEISSLRSNSPRRSEAAQEAFGVANANFAPGSKETGDAGATVEREFAQAQRVADAERIQSAKNVAAERLRIAYETTLRIADLAGEESAAYEEAQAALATAREDFVSGEIATIERQLNYAQQAALQKIQLERETLAQQEQLGEISAEQRIAGLQLLVAQEVGIEQQILDEKFNLYEQDIIKREEIMQRKLELERRFQGEVSQLRTQELQQASADVEAGLQPVANTMARVFNQIADGAMTWRKAWAGVLRSMRTEAINTAVEIAKNFIRNQIIQTQAHLTGNAIRSASDKQSALMSVAQMAWAAIKIIGIKAWEAASAVYASIAAIPYVGPFLAPAMAVGAAAAVIGFIGRISSAEGGYDIPSGVNPMTQLHAREMVLPAQYADVIRGLAGDGGGGGGGVSISMPITVNALDARGVDKVLMDRSATIARAIAKEVRDGRSIRS